VILAGGRGTRLKPLTDDRPKPMIEIGGRPFLAHQIEQLREQGFKKILLLLGYLPQVIRDYCGDGSRWGVKIEYSISALEDETGRRLKLAEFLLDPYFLLLYCDNYWPMNIAKMWAAFTAFAAPVMLTVYTNKDGYTRNSLRVGADGYIDVYDKSASAAELQGVEISYALMERSILKLLPEANVSLEQTLYTRLAREHRLSAYVTDHRYYSIGGFQRLPLTEQFFARKPTVILDRDGVLNKKPPRARYIKSWQEFEWLPGAKESLALLNAAGYRVIIISNQAGIARGEMTDTALETIHQTMKMEAAEAGGHIEAIYYCPHGWDDGCECRKPRPGMLFQAQRDYQLDLTRTCFIGDDDRDGEAAERAGCPFAQVSAHRPLIYWIREMLTHRTAEEKETHGTTDFIDRT
jgi:D-glycero-D-manno-heptose 1,7-bisphosphate phosphatase